MSCPCSGPHPRPHDSAKHYSHLTALDLDTFPKPSVLGTAIPAGSKVGVAGSSHSAVLVLKNPYELGNVSIVNFSGSPLLYAIYKDDWILYDNTGFKGLRQIEREKCWRLMIYLCGSAG